MALLRPGQSLRNGELEIIDCLGIGGFGEVYRAIWRRKDGHRTVAVKCFNIQEMGQQDLQAVKLVHQECLLIGSIKHPATVQIYGVDVEDGIPYLFEEFLEGRDLTATLQTRKLHRPAPHEPLFSPLELIQIGMQIAQALEAVHAKGIYHGDLKPGNICFRDEAQSEIALVDFGHGGFLEGNILGRQEIAATLAYLPPERSGFVKHAGNAASDLYSLGVTLYELCTGSPLFEAKNEHEFIHFLLHEVPKSLAVLYPGFPEPVADIVQKLLRKHPEERYSSALGLYADFERCYHPLKHNEPLRSFALGTKDKLRELNYKIPMVGRQSEMDRLLKTLEETLQGQGKALLIGAPSGSGKSRLAYEVVHRARMHNVHVTAAKFSEFERNLPLSAISLLLMDHAEFLKAMTPAQSQRWRQRLVDCLGSRGALISKRFAFYEGLLPDFPVHKVKDQDNENTVFNETLAEFMTLLHPQGEAQILLLDDLQWADWQSILVVRELAALGTEGSASATFLMGTYRSNEVDEQHPLYDLLLKDMNASQLMALGPLSRPEVNELVEHLLDETGPEVHKLEQIAYQLTHGNPFYIYEYLQSAIVSGIFAMREGSQDWYFDAEKSQNSGMSQGVAGLVSERIAKLNPFTQELILVASIVGPSVDFEVLSYLLTTSEATHRVQPENLAQRIQAAQDELIQKHLVLPHEKRLVFFHDKIREAALDQMSPAQRRHYHTSYGLFRAKSLLSQPGEVASKEFFEAAFHLLNGSPEQDISLSRHLLFRAAQAAVAIYAYAKAREFLQAASQLFPEHFAHTDALLREWISVHELWAHTLATSDQIDAAIKLLDRVLSYTQSPLERARLYGKRAQYSLTLFHHKDAMESAATGLSALGVDLITREWVAYLYLLYAMPLLILQALWFKFFGRQNQEVTEKAEKMRVELILAVLVPQFYTSAILSIANCVAITRELLPTKDSEYRAITNAYWGGLCAIFGARRTSQIFFSKSIDYFDRYPNPIQRGWVTFLSGYLGSFAWGNFRQAHHALHEANRYFASVGETFWRSVTLTALAQIDYFGGESGEASSVSAEALELWKKVQFVPTAVGCAMRTYLTNKQDEQLEMIMGITQQCEQEIHQQGYNTLDSVLSCLARAEIYFLRGEYKEALPLLRSATIAMTRKLHRSAYALYAPLLYSRTLLRTGQPLRALVPLIFCWVNQLMRVRIFYPQTLFLTGEWLWSLGLHSRGRKFIEAGIQWAYARRWHCIVAEGRSALGVLLIEKRPEQAEVYFQLARDYYEKRSWTFFMEQCERQLSVCRLKTQDDPIQSTSRSLAFTQHAQAPRMRQRIETNAMLEIFLRLSALGERERLLEALLDSLCACTGSEIGLILLPQSEQWQPFYGKGLNPHDLLTQGYTKFGVDRSFIDHCIQSGTLKPEFRPPQWQKNEQLNRGSVMVVPLVYQKTVFGYAYLGHSQIYQLFDERSLETVSPIASQAAITLQNIQLTEDLKIQNFQILELNHTLEARVEEQTRDIRSIMQHIPIGIFAIEGSQLVIHKDYSQCLTHLLGEDALVGKAALPLLFADCPLSSDEQNQTQNALSSAIGDNILSFTLNDHMLPRQLTKIRSDGHNQQWELSWNPMTNGHEQVDKVLVTLNDVTAMRQWQEAAREKAEETQMISEIVAVKDEAMQRFLRNARSFSAQNCAILRQAAPDKASLKIVFMNLHTVKGTARSLDFRLLADAFHQLEQGVFELQRADNKAASRENLQRLWERADWLLDEYERLAKVKLGRLQDAMRLVPVPFSDFSEAFAELRQYVNTQNLEFAPNFPRSYSMFLRALFTSLPQLLQELFETTRSLAKDLEKPAPELQIEVPPLGLDKQVEELLRNTFVHLIRNAMDHGLEPPDERIQQGKPRTGKLSLRASQDGTVVRLVFQDDGRGLNLQALQQKARNLGLLASDAKPSPEEIVEFVFASGLSTAESVTEISGRGVGMDAVRTYIQEAGGQIRIALFPDDTASKGFVPFAYHLELPANLFTVQPGTDREEVVATSARAS